jgi:multiple sugar transport system substrate-binding protein
MMNSKDALSRRRFLKGITLGGAAITTPFLLAACGGGNTGEAPGAATSAAGSAGATAAPAAPDTQATTAPATTSGAAVELTQWDWWLTQSPWLDNEITLFQEANPGITVKRTVQSGKFDELLQLAFKDGSAPDVFFTQVPFLDVVKNGYALPLSDFSDFETFKQGRPNPDLDIAEGSNALEGKVYTVPREARSAWWNQIYVNTAVLSKYGVNDIPKTLDEYLDAMRKVTKDSNGEAYGWGNPLSSGWTPAMQWYVGQLSGAPVGGDNYKTGKYDFSHPAYQKTLESFVTMKNEGLILPESSSLDDEAIRALFAEGRVAFFTGGVWVMPGWQQTHPDFKDYTIMPPPLIDTPEPITFFYTSPGQTGTATYINAQTKQKEAAWQWFQWLHSREAMQRWIASGNGLSLWTEDNNPDAVDSVAIKALLENDTKINRVAPARSLRNPDVAKVSEQAVKPSENDVISGLYSGQITDIPAMLTQFAADKNAAREQAIADAVAAGAKVSIEDYIFPDWDPTKDYITEG